MRPHSRILKKLKELSKKPVAESHGHGHGDGVVDYSKGEDSYLNILKPMKTLHQDLAQLVENL